MTSLALTHPTIWNRLEVIRKHFSPNRSRTEKPDISDENVRTRQEFILEMLNRNPESLQSELDVQHMMYSFPCRF